MYYGMGSVCPFVVCFKTFTKHLPQLSSVFMDFDETLYNDSLRHAPYMYCEVQVKKSKVKVIRPRYVSKDKLMNAITCEILDPASPDSECGIFM